jgi:hypothetical protein
MTENELLQELTKELYIPPVQLDEVTAQSLSKQINTTVRNALDILQAKEREGLLISRWARGDKGRRLLAFRKPD